MMLTVQSIPDYKPTNNNGARAGASQEFSLDNVRYIDEEDKHNPYKREFQKVSSKFISKYLFSTLTKLLAKTILIPKQHHGKP